MRGLPAPLTVKSSWTLDELAGHKIPVKMRLTLNRASWKVGDVSDDTDRALIVDETGFIKN